MKRPFILLLVLFLTLACGVGGIVVFINGLYLPLKPCRPISYPGGQTLTEERDQNDTADVPLNQVLQFYDSKFRVDQSSRSESGHWSKTKIDETHYLYDCYGVDINGLTTETGCIFVSQVSASKTRVLMHLYRSEGSNIPCQ